MERRECGANVTGWTGVPTSPSQAIRHQPFTSQQYSNAISTLRPLYQTKTCRSIRGALVYSPSTLTGRHALVYTQCTLERCFMFDSHYIDCFVLRYIVACHRY